MSCIRDSLFLWLVVAARPLHQRLVGLNTAADDQSFYHSATLISSFQHIPNNFRCRFRRVRSYDKEVIARMFSYRHLYQALGRHQPSTSSRAAVDTQAWYRCRYENIRVITSNNYHWLPHKRHACYIYVQMADWLKFITSQYENDTTNTNSTTFISFSDGMRVSNAHAVMPNIATIGNARMKYGEFAQLKTHNLMVSY